MYLKRNIEPVILKHLKKTPVTAIIGARQVGKSTLAKKILSHYKSAVYLDLELEKNRNVLNEPYLFFEENKNKVICIDEIQIMPKLFSEIKGFVDENPRTRFLILGSSSPNLIRESSESMAGRVIYHEIPSFQWSEVQKKFSLKTHWLKGGLPKSLLSEPAFSMEWRKNFIKTFLERDVRQFGYNFPPEMLRRIWNMLAHLNGQVLNYSQLANALGISSPTAKSYIDLLEYTFMIRRLQPYYLNVGKRIIKSPKIYFRDTGILHALLDVHDFNSLLAHPIYGFSWESYVLENIVNRRKEYQPYYYRTSNGSEIDLLLVKGQKKIAVEMKASAKPTVSDGLLNAVKDLKIDNTYIVAQVQQPYKIQRNITVCPFEYFMNLSKI